MSKSRFMLGALIAGLAASLFAQEPVPPRVALLATTLNADSEKFLELATAELTARGGFELVERQAIRQVLGEQAELLLYLAARAEHVRTVVRPALAAGQIVLCDRFCDSTLVYQSMVRGLPLATVQAANDFATGGLAPDLTFLFDADPLLLQARLGKRGGADRMEKEGLAFQQAVRQGFLTLAAHCPARIVTLDASRSEEEVFAAMKAAWIAFEAGKRGGSE